VISALAIDSGRLTSYPEVKVRCGLVPRNALVDWFGQLPVVGHT